MAQVMPGGMTANPFAWAEITARQQGYAATDANARAQQNSLALADSEIARQNALVQPQLDAMSERAVADVRSQYPNLYGSSGGSSSGVEEVPDDPSLIAISNEVFSNLNDATKAQYEPVLGSFNRRGLQYYRLRPTNAIPPPAPGANNAASQIAAQGGRPEPTAADLEAAGFTIRTNPDNTVSIYNTATGELLGTE